jgi:stearoyl-CoA desaturase (Delta-9 desaturase)
VARPTTSPLEENKIETIPQLTARRDRDGAEHADRRPSDSVAGLLPGQQPGAVSDCGGGHGIAHRLTNVAAIVIPLAAFVLAAVMLWGRFVEWIDLAVLAVGYVATCLGITVGFHRLLTHRSFQTYPAVRYALAVFGTLAVEGSVIKWVADHRKHHVFTDQEGDPHSPHEAGPGVFGALSGLWHAHIGWLFNSVGQADQRRYAADLLKDPGLRRIDGAEKPLIVASLAIPFVLGLLVKGTFTGALMTLVWGGLVRVFLLHHATFSINSICHFFGRRRFATKDRSTNVAWLSLATLGESWHNNHHAFPTSAFHGLRRRELDLGGVFIRALERAGLAWQVVRISPERQRQKAAPGTG